MNTNIFVQYSFDASLCMFKSLVYVKGIGSRCLLVDKSYFDYTNQCNGPDSVLVPSSTLILLFLVTITLCLATLCCATLLLFLKTLPGYPFILTSGPYAYGTPFCPLDV